ncbi:hypothetical protein B0H16DRAFT_1485639 [Mycena metata]|uniref:Uncharacterized protein n=1 Tax=Mycena metata TaxID=1033252 RepID=A0AAD7GK14_9AGAR|nr:hypothetical protein B0H16DRAFT_1485639 [Mycena metata]
MVLPVVMLQYSTNPTLGTIRPDVVRKSRDFPSIDHLPPPSWYRLAEILQVSASLAEGATYAGTLKKSAASRDGDRGWRKILESAISLPKPRGTERDISWHSIAGMVTARICADHFERVIIIDPELKDAEKPRTRIMHYHAAHVILTIFANGARRLWPEFDAEMKTVGGRHSAVDAVQRLRSWGVSTDLGSFEERVVRKPYTDCSCDTQRQRRLNWLLEPSEVFAHQKTERILNPWTFVIWTAPTPHSEMPHSSQSGLKWLKAAGFTLSNDIRSSYDGNIRYVTVCFTVSPELADKLPIPEAQRNMMLAYAYMPHEDVQSSCLALVLTENNTIQLVIEDTSEKELPRTASEILPFIATFPVVELLCEHGNPSFDSIRIADQSFVRYHAVPKGALPSNFIALGDVTMQLNPMHGQGFAKIMLNAMTLPELSSPFRRCIAYTPCRLFEPIFQEYLWVYAHLMLNPDYGSPCCKPMEGESKDNGSAVQWLENKLISAASQDDEVASAFWHIRHMLAADRALLAPTILWKILRTRSLFG